MTTHNRALEVPNEKLAAALAGTDYLLFDGGMGSLVQEAGLDRIHQVPDLLNFTHAPNIEAIHHRYVQAGADVITTNTFSANRLKLEGTGVSVEKVYDQAVMIARQAGAPLVAGDIGPTGSLLEPMGDLSFEEAYDIFAEQARAAEMAGCDLLVVETMADLREAKAAVLACVERTDLPVFATMTFGEDGRTFLGTTPAIAVNTLSALGASAVGLNCSLGPVELAELVAQAAPFARVPLMVQPNAGLPHIEDGKTCYDVDPADFALAMEDILDAGAIVVGGCCGTNPAHIRALHMALEDRRARAAEADRPPCQLSYQPAFNVASAQRMVHLPCGQAQIAVIGERINPTGKKKLKMALQEADCDYVVGEAVAQTNAQADILDVNVGVPGLDEPQVLRHVVETLQTTVPTPLQIDSGDAKAIEAAARVYAGRPMVNSVNGKHTSLQSVLPLIKRYGCTVVGLTLDENGIPPTAEERLKIARRIVETAESYGIPREDIAIDCLVMAAATNQSEIREILRAVTLVKEELGVRTVLGVSNVSFGLPQRPMVNATFLAAAFGAGLDMPILNPLAPRYRDTVNTFKVLNGQDADCQAFIAQYAQMTDPYEGGPAEELVAFDAASGQVSDPADCVIEIAPEFQNDASVVTAMVGYILAGRRAPLPALTEQLLAAHDSLDIINHIFVPVLDVVGAKYEKGEFFLPQLMASAEAVKEGFDVIHARQMQDTENQSAAEGEGIRSILVATVEGDIHDIGKNIVKMLLQNYGFSVVDLGRDVPPQEIVDAAREHQTPLIGLSALMTTTVGAMERTIELVHEQLPGVSVMVGGAVITQEFADSIQADFYAHDAAATARLATKFFDELETAL